MLYTTVHSIRLSRISLGTAPFGTSISRETAFSLLDRYVDFGGNLLDTAAIYGLGVSEKVIGAWMQERGTRNRVCISTKGCHPSLPTWEKRVSEDALRYDIESSLRNLRTDFVDVYFLHRDDPKLPVSEIMPMLDRLVREGKTRYLGASNWTVDRINQANAFARTNGLSEFSFSQIFWNAACINKEGVYDPTLVVMDDHEHEGYRRNTLPVMAYTSQAQGLFSLIQKSGVDSLPAALIRTYINPTTQSRAERILTIAAETGLSPTAIALGCLLSDDVCALPIIGVSGIPRMEESMHALNISPELCKTCL